MTSAPLWRGRSELRIRSPQSGLRSARLQLALDMPHGRRGCEPEVQSIKADCKLYPWIPTLKRIFSRVDDERSQLTTIETPRETRCKPWREHRGNYAV